MGFAAAAPIIGSIGSSVIGGLFGSKSTKDANKAAAAEAQASRDFVRDQMTSRHQWEVEDLKAAGLNPMLSAGAAPSMGPSAMANVTPEVTGAAMGASSAKEAMRFGLELANIKADTQLKKDQAAAATKNAESGAISAEAGAAASLANARLSGVTAAQKGVFTPAYEKAGDMVKSTVDKSDSFVDGVRDWWNNRHGVGYGVFYGPSSAKSTPKFQKGRGN